MEERIGDVQLVNGHCLEAARVRMVQLVPSLMTRANVSPKSTPASCVKSWTTHRTLYLSKLSSGQNLCLNTHLPVTRLACGGRGTKVHVLFVINLYFDTMLDDSSTDPIIKIRWYERAK
jgi:hypothetical protein